MERGRSLDGSNPAEGVEDDGSGENCNTDTAQEMMGASPSASSVSAESPASDECACAKNWDGNNIPSLTFVMGGSPERMCKHMVPVSNPTSKTSLEDVDCALDKEKLIAVADLFEVVCLQDDQEIVRQYLMKNKDLLDTDIVIRVTGSCLCPNKFEQHPRFPDDVEARHDMTSEIVEFIRRGQCFCEGAGKRWSSCRLTHLAASLGQAWLMEFLLDQGCEINPLTSCCQQSPLSLAVKSSYADVVTVLVSRAPSFLKQALSNTNLLHMVLNSTPYDYNPVLKILLDSGICDVNETNEVHETPLSLAVSNECLESVKLLLKANANPNAHNQHGYPVLHIAVQGENREIAAALLDAGADVDIVDRFEGDSPLSFACCTGCHEFAELLLERGADPNFRTKDGYTALGMAVDQGNITCVELLIKYGADIEFAGEGGFRAIHNSAWDGSLRCQELLLEHGASPDPLTACKNTPLALAAHGDHLPCVRSLLTFPVNANNADKDLDTPLHYAAYNGNSEAVGILLEHSANPCVSNIFNATPLWNAVYNRSLEVVQLLVTHNVPLETSSHGNDQFQYDGRNVMPLYNNERSVLWVAVERNSPEIVDFLLLAGYNIWREKWLIVGDETGFTGDSLDIVKHLRSAVQEAPSLLYLCRRCFRENFRERLEAVVQDVPLPTTLKDFLLLKDLR